MSKAAAASTAPAGEGPEPPAKAINRKKLLLMAGPIALTALLAGLWFGGILPPLLGLGGKHAPDPAAEAAKDGVPKPPSFIELPEIVANLNGGPRKTVYVKLQVRLELAKAEDETAVKAAMPRLQDLFQTYLREMRPEELRGSAGTYRLREELIGRANVAVAPARVVDVLFTEMLIQ